MERRPALRVGARLLAAGGATLRRRRRSGSMLNFDEAEFESRLVWIFGSPRSGSTWLLALLAHPLVPSDESPIGMDRLAAPDAGVAQAVPINEPYIPQHIAPPLFADQPVGAELAAVTLNSFRHAYPSYFLSDQYTDAWWPELRRLVLTRLEAQARRAAVEYSLEEPYVVIKEPNGSVGAGVVMSLFPASRLIFLLRDGRDVVDSMIDAQLPGSWLERPPPDPGHDPEANRLELVRHESRQWLARTSAVQSAYDHHPPDRRWIVRYEELRASPDRVLAELDTWLGVHRKESERASALRWNDFASYPAEAKGPGMPLRAARPGLWRENLSAEEQRAMTEIIGAKLAEVGYQTSARTN